MQRLSSLKHEVRKAALNFSRGRLLSLQLLRDRLSCIPEDNRKFLLCGVCDSERVTLEIVRYLFDLEPEGARTEFRAGYGLSLHRACLNPKCPSDVIEFLISKYDEALRISCWEVGLPLHCLICRMLDKDEIDSSDLSLVSIVVSASPEALTSRRLVDGYTPFSLACCHNKVSLPVPLLPLLVDVQSLVLTSLSTSQPLPIHSILGLERRPPHDVVQFLLNYTGEDELRSAADNGTPLHVACSNDYVPLEIIQLIVEKNHETVRCTGYRGDLPLHSFCKRNVLDLDILKYLIEQYPQGVRISNEEYHGLPVSYTIGKSVEATTTLVEAFPESVRIALVKACRLGCFETLARLCDLYPLAAVTQRSEESKDLLLHEAVEFDNGHRAAVSEFLIKRYPDSVKAKGERGDVPLLRLCRNDLDIPSIQTLFNAFPAAIHEVDCLKTGTFHIVYGKPEPSKEVIEFLFSKMACGLEMEDWLGLTPAHYACKNCSLAVVQDVLERWPDAVRVNSPTHGLLIHYACTHSADFEVVKYLHSQYPDSLDFSNHTVGLSLDCVARRSRHVTGLVEDHDVFVYLLVQRYKLVVFPLHEILQDDKVKEKKATALRLITLSPHHVSEVNGHGMYPLHLAVKKVPDIDFVTRLIELYPRAVEMQDSQGWLPLHYALRCQPQHTLVKCLLEAHPRGIEVVDNQRRTPLHVACQYGSSVEVVRYLLEVGRTVVRILDDHGCTPLHIAARHGASLEVIMSLVDADPNPLRMTDSNMDKPLHLACRGGHGAIASYLAKRHMQAVSETDSTGLLPALLLAQSSGSIQESNLESKAESLFPCLDATWFLLRNTPDICQLHFHG